MNNWEVASQEWLQDNYLDSQLKRKLQELKPNRELLKDAFCTSLAFDADGMSGRAGPGTNRMNMYTVRKAAKGLADYLKGNHVNYKDRGVVISYDSSELSIVFAKESAKTLGKSGIKVYLFSEEKALPIVSYAIRYLGAVLGLCFVEGLGKTAGYSLKLFNDKGSQLTYNEIMKINQFISQKDNSLHIPVSSLEDLNNHHLLEWINGEMENAYMENLLDDTKLGQHCAKGNDLKIVYAPFENTLKKLILTGLEAFHFSHLSIMEGAFNKASAQWESVLEYDKENPADIVCRIDSFGDTLHVAVRQNDVLTRLTGEELSVLLLDFILRQVDEQMLNNARVIKAIGTSAMINAICEYYGVKVKETGTDFSEIGDMINEFDRTGETFIFACNENDQYLIDGLVRYSDAIQSSFIVCKMAQYWKNKEMNLFNVLDELYEKHGDKED